MLEGWRVQQLARNPAFSTVGKRLTAIRAFAHADAFPWLWKAQMLDEWLGDLRSVGGLRRPAIRNYALAVSAVLPLPDQPGLRMGRNARRGSARTRSRCAKSGTPRYTS